MKAVVDTNVLISGIFWSGTPAKILAAWADARFQLVVSPEILDEYQDVIERLQRKHPGVNAGRDVLRAISIHAAVVRPLALPGQICDDPDDDKFLAAALAAEADCIVSGDAALLRTHGFRGVRVVRPSAFLRLI